MNHPEATRQDKAKQIWRVKLTESETTELLKHSATDCLLQLHTLVFWNYIGGIWYDLVDILQ
jgi:hypothetical protein